MVLTGLVNLPIDEDLEKLYQRTSRIKDIEEDWNDNVNVGSRTSLANSDC
jgi:hypothetical protein